MQPLANAFLPDHERFVRLAEEAGGVLGVGGFGTVFQGYDKLRGEQVTIKRQDLQDEAASREAAC